MATTEAAIRAQLQRVGDEVASHLQRVEALMVERDALILEVHGWGVDSARKIARMARTSHTSVQRLIDRTSAK
jgi:hypothetical protein